MDEASKAHIFTIYSIKSQSLDFSQQTLAENEEKKEKKKKKKPFVAVVGKISSVAWIMLRFKFCSSAFSLMSSNTLVQADMGSNT